MPSNDTYQYARQTLRFSGDSQQVAVHDSVAMFCSEVGNDSTLVAKLQTVADKSAGRVLDPYDACMDVYRNGLTPASPRYVAIFTSRPLYPLLAVPFIAVFGLTDGMWATTMVCLAAASLLVLALLRSLGCDRRLALAGQALFFVAPTGYWGSRMLTDGPSLLADLLCLLGAWWLVGADRRGGRIWPGAAVFTAGVVAGFAFRYSTATMVALVLALAALLSLWRLPETRSRGMYRLAALAGAATVLSQLLATLLGWPGFSDSLQDTFTNHFIRPDVSDPLKLLWRSNLSLWRAFPDSSPEALLLIAGLVVTAVALWRRDRVWTLLCGSVALVGVASVIAHPIASQDDRLIMPAWLLVVLGLPVLFARRPAADGAPAAIPTAPDAADGSAVTAGAAVTAVPPAAAALAAAPALPDPIIPAPSAPERERTAR